MTIIVKEGDPHGTLEQRRTIDAQLAEGLEDIRECRVSARFDTVEEMLASLRVPCPR